MRNTIAQSFDIRFVILEDCYHDGVPRLNAGIRHVWKDGTVSYSPLKLDKGEFIEVGENASDGSKLILKGRYATRRDGAGHSMGGTRWNSYFIVSAEGTEKGISSSAAAAYAMADGFQGHFE